MMISKLMCKVTAVAVLLASVAVNTALAQPKPKSQKEIDAIMAIQNAPDNESRVKAVDELLTKFADTEFKGYALYIATVTLQQMGDYERMVVYGERALEADPKNFQVMLALAGGLAQRTKEFDLDKEEKLKKAENLVSQALEAMKTAQKPNPQLPDEQWEAIKKDTAAEAHTVLGQIAGVRKKWDVAANEYKTAVDTAAQVDPATLVRLANAYNQSKKPDEAIAALDKLNTLPEVHPAVKNAATAERNTAMKLKAAAK